MRFTAGLDGGSVSVKLAILDERRHVVATCYRRHRGRPLETARDLLAEAMQTYPGLAVAVTGGSGKLIAQALGAPHINELIAHALSTARLYPQIRSIIEMGGEDSKLILLDAGPDPRPERQKESAGMAGGIRDFALNSVCAAGTGSFLDQQAERMRLTIEEFAAQALHSSTPPPIAGRCSVFAKSDMIHLQQIATPMEDIAAGLCFSVARNFKGAIVRGRKVPGPVAFMGGVALNAGMVRAFREVFGLAGEGDLVIPSETTAMGAIGAALKAAAEGTAAGLDEAGLSALTGAAGGLSGSGDVHPPLVESSDDFLSRHAPHDAWPLHPVPEGEVVDAFLGVDIGSISTNLAVIDAQGRLLARRYLRTASRPIEAVRTGLAEIGAEIADRVRILGVGTTGSGRYMIADFIRADVVKNEITAQATAAAFIDPLVDTIFEIGGQDSKYISLKDGVITDFEMNKACAAGTGSFLEEQAEKLDVSVKGQFSDMALSSGAPCRLGERCTVFMENSLMAGFLQGAPKNDLLAGLAYSIVENYVNRVVAGRPIGERIFFQGGTAFNTSVTAAFEKYLGRKIVVPPNHDVTGAIGMALIARDHMAATGSPESTFRGFDLATLPYSVRSFECKGCENRCEINRVTLEGEDGHLFYGGRCEKYDIRKKTGGDLPDLFARREELLLAAHEQHRAAFEESGRPARRGAIGLPWIFFFHDYLPYFSTLLWELGFEVKLSPRTGRRTVALGVETVLADTCFPIKAAHGHVRSLLDAGVKNLFIPSFINLSKPGDPYTYGLGCPLTQSYPYQVRVAFEDARVVSPVIRFNYGDSGLLRRLEQGLAPLGVSRGELRKAMAAASRAQDGFRAAVKACGRDVLEGLTERALVIIGRPYNAFDMGMNLEIPKKLASLGVISIPMDFLPGEDVSGDWPDMYWRSGQRLLRAARHIRKNPLLYPLFIGNFSCGPDSFIQKYLDRELGHKPYLHIEIDEHSADAGAITRCEAFLDSIQMSGRRQAPKPFKGTAPAAASTAGKRRMVYLPPMCDHAHALSAAFRACGVESEVLPPTDAEAIALGRKNVSGKECYPFAVTTGDMLKKILSPGFEPGRSAFFMPSGAGPCRFGQYNVAQRLILDDLGLGDIPIFAPVQDETFYKAVGMVGRDFARRSWEGIVAIDLLTKLLHETRPYETRPGSSDAAYGHHLGRLINLLSGGNGVADQVESLLREARHDFAAIPREVRPRPLIGIVGEIFVRSNTFSNENLVRKIEALGGQAWLAPIEEWVCYTNFTATRRARRTRSYRSLLQLMIKSRVQRSITHRFEAVMGRDMHTLHEPGTETVLAKAAPYIHNSFEGEAVLSVGKAVDMIERGAAGIVNAMPFGCMPGSIVSAILRGVSKRYGVPTITIPYDGTASSVTQLQLEAFMDQASALAARRPAAAGLRN